MKIDLNDVVATKVSAEGVLAVTKGALIGAAIREGLRGLLKDADPEGYALYRATKYPAGEGSDTVSTRLAATRFLFDRARDVFAAHYVSALDLTGSKPDEASAGWDVI